MDGLSGVVYEVLKMMHYDPLTYWVYDATHGWLMRSCFEGGLTVTVKRPPPFRPR